MWKPRTTLSILPLLAMTLLFSACGEEGGGGNNGGNDTLATPPPFKALAPAIDADSAYDFVAKQVAFGPRIPNTKAHAECAAWMAAEFTRFGAQVTVQQADVRAFDGTTFAIKNIIAAYNPSQVRRIRVTAHWDSRPYADKDAKNPKGKLDGANDGGSGVAVILELARQFSLKAPSIGVDLILWDAEDYGNYSDNESWCLGSQYWAKNPHQPGYRALYGINLDMVGAKDARFTKDAYSMQYASLETDKLWNIAHNLGYGAYFPLQNKGFASIDDHYFIIQIAGIPMVEVIDRNVGTGEFFPHWHTTEDKLDKIDKATLQAVGQTVLEVIYREQ